MGVVGDLCCRDSRQAGAADDPKLGVMTGNQLLGEVGESLHWKVVSTNVGV